MNAIAGFFLSFYLSVLSIFGLNQAPALTASAAEPVVHAPVAQTTNTYTPPPQLIG